MAKVKLDSLPASDDKFWEHAEVAKHRIASGKKCKHHFVRRTGTRAECTKCRVGYFLTPDLQVRNGHIYTLDELVI